jgi:hypothetical protein
MTLTGTPDTRFAAPLRPSVGSTRVIYPLISRRPRPSRLCFLPADMSRQVGRTLITAGPGCTPR